MATKVYDFSRMADYTFNEDELVVLNNSLSLRRVDDQGRSDPHGYYAEYALIELPTLNAESISQIYSIEAQLSENEGSVTFQIQKDGTYYYYDDATSTWIQVTDDTDPDQFSTMTEIDANIDGLDWDYRGPIVLGLKCRLQSNSDFTKTPTINNIWYTFETKYDYIEDLRDSILAHLEQHISINMKSAFVLSEETDTIDINRIVENDITILEVEEVRISGDTENLFDSYDESEGIVTLKSQQSSGSTLIMYFKGQPTLSIGSNVNYELEPTNYIIVELNTCILQDFSLEGYSEERALGRETGRVRHLPEQHVADVLFRCISNLGALVDKFASDVNRVFKDHPTVTSLASGFEIYCLDRASFQDTSPNVNEIFSLAGAFSFQVEVPEEAYTEYGLITELEFLLGTGDETISRNTLNADGSTTNEQVHNN